MQKPRWLTDFGVPPDTHPKGLDERQRENYVFEQIPSILPRLPIHNRVFPRSSLSIGKMPLDRDSSSYLIKNVWARNMGDAVFHNPVGVVSLIQKLGKRINVNIGFVFSYDFAQDIGPDHRAVASSVFCLTYAGSKASGREIR